MLTAITAVSAAGAYLMTPRPGGRMDPNSTGPDGTHALVALLSHRGVEVVVAGTVDDVTREAGPGTLTLIAETSRIGDGEALDRLTELPGDLLLVAPGMTARNVLAPDIRSGPMKESVQQPDCELRQAQQAGPAYLGTTSTFVAAPGQSVDSCYGGALVRYREGDRTITLVGSDSFMTNRDLARQGNAALAMNLAGSADRLIWFAPQRRLSEADSTATLFDLIPTNVRWLFWQLCVALTLAALWQGRRLGPLVAEPLPVVVRASETVEGLGRLYRSHRARDRAAAALRDATLRRLAPRLGLGPTPDPPELVSTAARRINARPDWLWHLLFGPPPHSDDALVALSRALDDIERQVTHS
ncbi:DUF4350 domain-containing protein [Mycolicibacter minnesotensis]